MKVAQEAIETIYGGKAASAGDVGYFSAWWYNVLFLYTSATVLIAARLSPSILAEVSEESILDGWRKAMEVLEEYGVFGTSIRRLTDTLRLLFDAVPQQYSRPALGHFQTNCHFGCGSLVQIPTNWKGSLLHACIRGVDLERASGHISALQIHWSFDALIYHPIPGPGLSPSIN